MRQLDGFVDRVTNAVRTDDESTGLQAVDAMIALCVVVEQVAFDDGDQAVAGRDAIADRVAGADRRTADVALFDRREVDVLIDAPSA